MADGAAAPAAEISALGMGRYEDSRCGAVVPVIGVHRCFIRKPVQRLNIIVGKAGREKQNIFATCGC